MSVFTLRGSATTGTYHGGDGGLAPPITRESPILLFLAQEFGARARSHKDLGSAPLRAKETGINRPHNFGGRSLQHSTGFFERQQRSRSSTLFRASATVKIHRSSRGIFPVRTDLDNTSSRHSGYAVYPTTLASGAVG